MTNAAAPRQSAWASQPSWFRCALFVGFGGMIYLALALFVAAALAEMNYEDRIVQGDSTDALQWIGWGAGSVAVGMFLLLRLFRVRPGRALWLILSWVAGSALIAVIGSQYGAVSFLIFFPVWIGYAIPAGVFVALVTPNAPPRMAAPRHAQTPPPRSARQPQPPPPPRAPAGPRIPGLNMTGMASNAGPEMVIGGPGGFGSAATPAVPFGTVGAMSMAAQPGRTRVSALGRIPPEVADLISSNVSTVRSAVLSEIRADTAAARRGFTSAAVMDRVLRDWWENGNVDPLTPDDIVDLQSFIALALSLTRTLPNPDGEAVYRCLLNALLDDWLVSWNADGNIGPPVR